MSLSEKYNEAAPSYDAGYRETINYVEEWIIGERVNELRPLGRVLSLGCGTGHDITMCQLEPEGFLGADISTGMLAQAQNKYPGYGFVQKDARTPFKGSWDTVLAIFGLVNYVGLDVVLARFKEVEASKLFMVMFAPQYAPSIVNTELHHYSAHQVREKLCGMSVGITGLTFPIPGDNGLSINALYETQKALAGNLEGCNYWVVDARA